MRAHAMLGAVLGVGIVLGGAMLWGGHEAPSPQREVATGVQSRNWMVMSATTDRVQQIVVADPAIQALAVYHVDLITGRIALKSVRNVRFDLLMTEFNTEAPSPRDLESLWKSP